MRISMRVPRALKTIGGGGHALARVGLVLSCRAVFGGVVI